jgi:hypothetical protein
LSAAALVLAAGSMFLTAAKWTTSDSRAQKAVCAIVSYAEVQATTIRAGIPARDGEPARPGNPRAARGLEKLARDMRATGIDCPPRRSP